MFSNHIVIILLLLTALVHSYEITQPLLSPLSQPSRTATLYDTARYYPFSSYFVNEYDYADAQSYSTNLFYNLLKHMNAVKRESHMCKNIPVPKTVLNKKYFNPEYELLQYKYWYPPKDHQYILVWAQNEAYRSSLFLSYMLQGNHANFPPGWLYMYLSAAAQLHSMQSLGSNSHKSVKAIKIPFESNEVFKVNWWDNGNYQKMEKPFAIYASQPRNSDTRYVRVTDFGTGDYTTDYTGHAFIPNYLYDRQKFLLNNTYEANAFLWYKQPYNQQNPQPVANYPAGHASNQNFHLQIGADPNIVKLVRPADTDPVYAQNKQQLEMFYKQFQNSENFNQNNPLNNINTNTQQQQQQQFKPTLPPNPHHQVKLDQIALNYPPNPPPPQYQKRQKRRRLSKRAQLEYNANNPVSNDKAFSLYEFQQNRFKDSQVDQTQYSLNELAQNNDFTQYQYFLNQYKSPNLADPNNILQPSPNQQANFNTNPNLQYPVPVLNNLNLNANQQQYYQQQAANPKNPNQDRPYYSPDIMLMNSQQNRHQSLDQFSPFLFINKNTVQITSWDPLVDNQREDMSRVSDRNSPTGGFDRWYIKAIEGNIDLDQWKYANENPLYYQNLSWIDTYRYANVWWANETAFRDNRQDYVFRIKPEESYVKFNGAKFENGVSWTAPYFWCPDPTNWLVTVRSPIWATNDFHYKNRIYESKDPFRFVGLSEVVLNYEELDVNQCPGDRELNAFASTSLCDSTTNCLPLPLYGLQSGGYECQCLGEYHYPNNFQGPYMGKDIDYNPNVYPLCKKSEGLIQYPNWISKNAVDFIIPPNSVGTMPLNGPIFDRFLRRRRRRQSNDDEMQRLSSLSSSSSSSSSSKPKKRTKRFIDKRNNFEKLKDSIYENQDDLQRRCAMQPFKDILYLNEDDERFILNLRYHANEVFKPQMAQALRIAHLLSAYLQLHSPFGASSIYTQNEFGKINNFNNNLRTDPQLEEYILIGEAMAALQSNYPIQEVNIFFNGTEFERQKFFATQVNLGLGLSAIRSDIELILNKTTDHTHLHKTWYKDAIDRFMFGGTKSVFGGLYNYDDERKFYQNAGPFDANSFKNSFKLDRYGVEMSLRRGFDGLSGNVEIPAKYYDAASSGVWFGPYYDCQKRYMKTRTSLRMGYSVPIITSMNKPFPVGFVNIVIGSDLKWWKINPCDTSHKRNMFQGLHRCDRDTTVCQYQEIPDFENGYYLASYKCLCKMNYEFPFNDYGSSYFEGATVEKEYEKMLKGLPNVYDRLKCRPIAPRQKARASGSSSYYWNAATSQMRRPSEVDCFSFVCLFLATVFVFLST